jgi:hypothetical protein
VAQIGINTDGSTLTLWRGRDFKWAFENLDANGNPTPFPDGRLFFEFRVGETPTEWDFTISGATATIKVEHTDVALIPNRAEWQLVFMPDGEAAGGDPVERGRVAVVG